MNRRLLHQIKLVNVASISNPIAKTLGRRPANSAMILKNDETNNRNEQEFDRVENKRQRLIKFPIIPRINIGKPT
jgi:hypothetical protein